MPIYLLTLLVTLSDACAETITSVRTLIPKPTDGADLRGTRELFGVSVAISEDDLVVGADLDRIALPASDETAFLFGLPAGDFHSRITEPTNTGNPGDPVVSAANLEDFGASVAADGGIMVIGARNAQIGSNTKRGAAYVYEKNNNQFELLREVTVAGTSDDRFGSSVAVRSDGKAVIGMPGVDDGIMLTNHGSAYFYSDIRSVNPPVTLTADGDRRLQDEFGAAVTLSDSRIVVGAPSNLEDSPGRVYVFDTSGTRQFMLTSGEPGDSYGFSVDIDGDFLAVGAPLADAPGVEIGGAVYVYDLSLLNNNVCDASNGCPPTAKFFNENAMSLDLFGAAVAVDGDRVLVGAPLARRDPNDSVVAGAAYLYDVSAGLTPIDELVAGSSQFGDAFGIAVDLSGNLAVVGASQTEEACVGVPDCEDTGSAYFFKLSELLAGDSDQDFDFDQFDLIKVQVAAKYLTGQPATWGEGDWDGAPGGRHGSPPAGDGFFSQPDIIAALSPAHYLTGPYASTSDGDSGSLDQTVLAPGENNVTVTYDADTGNLSVDAPRVRELTSIHLQSADGSFGGGRPAVLDGTFDSMDQSGIFKATFGGSFESVEFGELLPTQRSADELLADLSLQGTWHDGGRFEGFTLVLASVPEPHTMGLLGFCLACIILVCRQGWERSLYKASIPFVMLTALGNFESVWAVGSNEEGNVATLTLDARYSKKCDESAETCTRIVWEEDRFRRFFNNGFKVLIDPPALQEALLSVQFDPGRVELNAVRYLGGFEQASPPEILDGILRVHARAAAGSEPNFDGNVNFVELFFDDLNPRLPPTDAIFSVFAGPDDFLDLLAEDGTPLPRLTNAPNNDVPIIPHRGVRVDERMGLIPDGEPADEVPSIAYRRATGELAIDLPAGTRLNAINIASETGIFTGDDGLNLDGNFDVDEDNVIFKTVFDGVGFESLSFGNVAQADLDRDFLLTDLEVRASLAGDPPGPAGVFDLVYITNPEPATSIILLVGLAILLGNRSSRRRINSISRSA